jgi:hypothetical protein
MRQLETCSFVILLQDQEQMTDVLTEIDQKPRKKHRKSSL